MTRVSIIIKGERTLGFPEEPGVQTPHQVPQPFDSVQERWGPKHLALKTNWEYIQESHRATGNGNLPYKDLYIDSSNKKNQCKNTRFKNVWDIGKGSPVAPPAIQKTQETWVRSLGWGDPLKNVMATQSSILPWRIPWTEEPGRLQSIGSQGLTWLKRLITYTHIHTHTHTHTHIKRTHLLDLKHLLERNTPWELRQWWGSFLWLQATLPILPLAGTILEITI